MALATLLAALPCAILAGSVAAAPPRPVIAVHRIEVSGLRLTSRVVTDLTESLAAELASSGKYQVMPGAEIKALLRKGKLASKKECVDRSCWIDLFYRELAANKLLVTRVMKLGRRCTVTSTLYDLLHAASERAARVKGGCGVAALQDAMDKLVRQLTGRKRESADHPGGSDTPLPLPPPEPGPGTTQGQDLPPVKPEVGTLIVEGTPKGAQVDAKGPRSFRGQKAAWLPYTWRSVPSGRYEVRVRKAKYDEHRSTVQVQTDRTKVVSVKLELSHGSLWVGGAPAGATVVVTDSGGFSKKWGLTSGFTLRGVPRGAVTLKVSRGGYEGIEHQLQVEGGQVGRVAVKMKREAAPPAASHWSAGEFPSRAAENKKARRLAILPSQTDRLSMRAKTQRKMYRALADGLTGQLNTLSLDSILQAASRNARYTRGKAVSLSSQINVGS